MSFGSKRDKRGNYFLFPRIKGRFEREKFTLLLLSAKSAAVLSRVDKILYVILISARSGYYKAPDF